MKVRNSLSKPTKRVAATIVDPHKRGEYIKLMMMAERTPLSTGKSKSIKSKDDGEDALSS